MKMYTRKEQSHRNLNIATEQKHEQRKQSQLEDPISKQRNAEVSR